MFDFDFNEAAAARTDRQLIHWQRRLLSLVRYGHAEVPEAADLHDQLMTLVDLISLELLRRDRARNGS